MCIESFKTEFFKKINVQSRTWATYVHFPGVYILVKYRVIMKKILFQNVFKIYSYETLFSFNYNSYQEKKATCMVWEGIF